MFGYSLFTLVLILLSALILTTELNRRLEREADKGNRGVLSQVQIYGDSAVVGRIKGFVAEKFLDLSQDPSVMEFFTGERKTSSLIQVQKAVNALSLQGSAVLSVHLYRQSDDTLVSSDAGISFHALGDPSQAAPNYDATLLRKVLREATEPQWVEPLANRPFWKNRSVLTYAQTVPLFSRGDEPLGCFLVNLDSEQLRSLLLTAKGGSYDFNLSIITTDGRVVAAETQGELDSPTWGLTLRNWSNGSDNGMKVTSVGGEAVAVAWSRSTLTDWKYFSVTPLSRYREPLFAVLQGVALVVVFLSLLGLAVVNVLTFRLHAPLQRLVAKARLNLGPKGSGEPADDWSVVDEALQKLSTQVTQIERTLRQNAPLIERTIVEDLLAGRVGSPEAARERLAVVGKGLADAPLRLVTFLWEPRTYESLPWDRREFLSYALLDRIDQAFHRDPDHLLAQVTGGGVTCLSSLADDSILVGLGTEVLEGVHKTWGVDLNVIVGESIAWDGLVAARERSVADAEFGFFTGYGRVWLSAGLRQRGASEAEVVSLRAWEAALRTGRSEDVEDLVFEVLAKLRNAEVTPASGHRLLRQLVELAARVWNESGTAAPGLSEVELTSALDGLRSLAEFREAFHGWLGLAARIHDRRDNALDLSLLNTVTGWIDGHLDRSLSLTHAASQVGMGESHFSRWFKRTLGIGFAEYVTQRKFEAAASRLSSDSTTSVRDLAHSLGYSDLSYFSKLFKQRFGMTPMQYRKRAIADR